MYKKLMIPIGRTMQLAAEYRLRTVQCLVTSDYTKSVDNTIEALVLYVHGEYSIQHDSEVAIWVIIGIIVRLAMRKLSLSCSKVSAWKSVLMMVVLNRYGISPRSKKIP